MKTQFAKSFLFFLVLSLFSIRLDPIHCMVASRPGQASGGGQLQIMPLLVIFIIIFLFIKYTTCRSGAYKFVTIPFAIFAVASMMIAVLLLNTRLFELLTLNRVNMQTIYTQLFPVILLMIFSFLVLLVSVKLSARNQSKYIIGIVVLCVGFLMLQHIFDHLQRPVMERVTMQESVVDVQPEPEQTPDVIENLVPQPLPKSQITEIQPLKTEMQQEPPEQIERETDIVPQEIPEEVVADRSVPFTETHGLLFWTVLFLATGIILIILYNRGEKPGPAEHAAKPADSKNPFTCIWTNPRQAYNLINSRFSRIPLFMIITIFSAFVIIGLSAATMGSRRYAESNVILRYITLALLSGIIFLPVLGLGLQGIARLFKGKGTWRNNMTSLATAHIPTASLIILWIGILIIFGDGLFRHSFAVNNFPVIAVLFLILVVFIYQIVIIWGIVISIPIISQANEFSKWRAFFSLVLLDICILIIAVPIKMIF